MNQSVNQSLSTPHSLAPDAVLRALQQREADDLAALRTFVGIPSVSTDPEHAGDVRHATTVLPHEAHATISCRLVDENGVVVVPAGDLADVVLQLPALLERERAVQADIAAGLGLSRQRPWRTAQRQRVSARECRSASISRRPTTAAR